MNETELTCFMCDKKTLKWHKDIHQLTSKHSGTPIVDFIRTFLRDYVSKRNPADASNCICSECLSRIHSYDWMQLKLKEEEKELRCLLLRTETKYRLQQLITEGNNSTADNDTKKEDLSSINGNVENTKKSKPIIVRVVKRVPFLKKQGQTDSSNQSISKQSTVLKQSKTPLSKAISLKCIYCDAQFTDNKSLDFHQRVHYQTPGLITCHLCRYKVQNMDEFGEHMKLHINLPPKQCVICNKGGTDNFDLANHVHAEHNSGAANLLCDVCGKTFRFTSGWRKHKETHMALREQCPHCEKVFKRKRTLNEHIKTHNTNERRGFACSFCSKEFKRKDHCRAHEKRHREDTKKNKCIFCPAAFESKQDLNLHLQRKHDAEKPHDKTRR